MSTDAASSTRFGKTEHFWGEHGSGMGVPRILARRHLHDVKAPVFVPALAVLLHGDEQRKVVAEGLDIAMYGGIHEPSATRGHDADGDPSWAPLKLWSASLVYDPLERACPAETTRDTQCALRAKWDFLLTLRSEQRRTAIRSRWRAGRLGSSRARVNGFEAFRLTFYGRESHPDCARGRRLQTCLTCSSLSLRAPAEPKAWSGSFSIRT